MSASSHPLRLLCSQPFSVLLDYGDAVCCYAINTSAGKPCIAALYASLDMTNVSRHSFLLSLNWMCFIGKKNSCVILFSFITLITEAAQLLL